jgi:hypothetical protein
MPGQMDQTNIINISSNGISEQEWQSEYAAAFGGTSARSEGVFVSKE